MAGAHQVVHCLDPKGGVGERIRSGASSRKETNPLAPEKEEHLPRCPELETGGRAQVCHSSPTPPFPLSFSLFSLLPNCRVFSLFTGGLLAPVPRPLSPLLAPPAGHDDDEEEDHCSDAASNSQGQQEKVGEGG